MAYFSVVLLNPGGKGTSAGVEGTWSLPISVNVQGVVSLHDLLKSPYNHPLKELAAACLPEAGTLTPSPCQPEKQQQTAKRVL